MTDISTPQSRPSQNRLSRNRLARNRLARLFLAHPSSVDESYFEHMRFALGFAFWLGVAALAALIHAILPFACETTASRIIRRLFARIEHRGAVE